MPKGRDRKPFGSSWPASNGNTARVERPRLQGFTVASIHAATVKERALQGPRRDMLKARRGRGGRSNVARREFVHRQRIAATGFIQRQEAAAHGCNDLGFAANDPPLRPRCREIGKRQRAAVGPDDGLLAKGFGHVGLASCERPNEPVRATPRILRFAHPNADKAVDSDVDDGTFLPRSDAPPMASHRCGAAQLRLYLRRWQRDRADTVARILQAIHRSRKLAGAWPKFAGRPWPNQGVACRGVR